MSRPDRGSSLRVPVSGEPGGRAAVNWGDPLFRSELLRQLAAGLAVLQVQIEQADQERLLEYLALLAKWTQVYNLTAIREPKAMLIHHLLDSLAVLPALRQHSAEMAGLRAPRLADIGSGAGLPGIPLALAWPGSHWTLVEAVEKKATFLRQAVVHCGLSSQVVVACSRVQALQVAPPFDFIVCRAYSALSGFVADVQALAGPATRLVTLKGEFPAAEIAVLPPGWQVESALPINVPFLSAQRHLVWLREAASDQCQP